MSQLSAFEPASARADQPLATPPVFTFEQIMAQFLRWDASWSDRTINYSFYNSRPAHLSGDSWWTGFRSFTPAQREAIHRAFDLIADVVNLTFIEVPDNQQAVGPANRRITFATSTTFPAWATGAADVNVSPFERVNDDFRIYSSETLFNFTRWSGSYAPGTRPFSVALHEVLHGLGLPHPGDYNRNPNEEITYARHADYAQDTGQYSVMSYFGAHESGAEHWGSFGATLLLHDVAAMQRIYGANMTTRTGDTVYGFNSTAGRSSYDFSINTRPVVTIWDAGGVDTLDCSGFGAFQIIDLTPGAFSDVGGLTRNVSIAFGTQVENARGGWGVDHMGGGEGDNRLDGGAGDDRLDGRGGHDVLIGGDGFDIVVFDGDYEDVFIKSDGEGGWLVSDGVQQDRLTGVEQITFRDIAIAPEDRPVICEMPIEAVAAKDSGWLI